MARISSVSPRPATRLYLITPARFDDVDIFAERLRSTLEAGDVAALQIRLKDVDDDVVRRAVLAILPVARARDVAVILNDRPDLAADTGCDGVHIGQGDAPLVSARRIMGDHAMIGVTCHDSRDLAMEAAEAGADYVAFGAFFPTTTKAASHQADPEILTIWQETVEVPCVAIGGITADNAGLLASAGADFVAISAAVWSHPHGPEAGVAAINASLQNG